MKRILSTILAAVVILVGNYFFSNGTLEVKVETPTSIVTSTPPVPLVTLPASGSADVSYLGTSFTIPLGLANGTQNETVPQTSPDEPMLVWPAHTKIVLQGYPLLDTLYKPQILIFPADEYQKISNDPASSEYDARTMISSLQSILSTQNFPLQGYYLPALPDQHARQIFHAQETILPFKNGNGIRYITEYSQAAFPAFGGGDMLYTFQGLTNDGKYYVSVMMPIDLADLEPMPESAANPAQYPDYLMKTISQINQAGNPFNPSIESLDALAESLLVGLPATSDMTPSTATQVAPPIQPTASLSARDFIPPLGTVTGNLSFPSSFIPAMRVVFFSLTDGSVSYTDTGMNQGTYSMDLPAGTYHVVAYPYSAGIGTPPVGSPIAGGAGGYTQFVPCGLSADCTDHSLIPITVVVGQNIIVNPGDWYAPEGTFPPMPTDQ